MKFYHKHPFMKWVLLTLASLVTLALICVISLYFIASYRPDAYHPIQLSPQNQQAVLNLGIKKLEEFHNNLTASNTFTYTLTTQFINQQIACRDNQAIINRILGRFNTFFKNPQIAANDNTITLMGEVNQNHIRGILSISLHLEVTPAGLTITLAPLKIGALTLPQSLQNKLTTPISSELNSMVTRYRRSARKKDLFNKSFGPIITQLPQLLVNKSITVPPQIYPFEDIKAHIDTIQARNNQITLKITPSPM